MQDFLIYDAKVAVLIVVFYMFYRLLLSKDTFHRVNRLVLLFTAVASFVLPLCVITFHKTVTLTVVPNVTVGDFRPEVIAEEASEPWWMIALPVIYIIGMLVTLGHTLLSVWKVMMLIRHSEQHRQADGTTLCVVNQDLGFYLRRILLQGLSCPARFSGPGRIVPIQIGEIQTCIFLSRDS